MKFASFVATTFMLVLSAHTTTWADDARMQQASEIMQSWLEEAAMVSAMDSAEFGLPAGCVLDRVVIREHFAMAYVETPAEFLENLTDLKCEAIISEQVARLKRVSGVTGFGIMVRPLGDDGDFHPLPTYLPKPVGQFDKPEFPTRNGGTPTYNPGRPQGALSGKTVFLSPGHGWYYSDTLGRWATQRGNSYGIIEDHSNGEAVFNHLARYLHNAGANVWTCRERDFNTNMVIIDNSDAAPDFTTTGTWPSSTAAGNWQGADYQYHVVSTVETAAATYAPSIPSADYYSVYIWTPSSSNRATDALVRVNHTGGTTEHIINMQQDGNTWRFLGIYYYNEGRDVAKGSVEISNQGSDPSKYVIADAVRFGGGMGDYPDGGSPSGWPRWEESGKYYPVFMGQTDTPNGTVWAMPIYAKWESESWEDSVYVSWHSNATGGSWEGHGSDIYVYGPNGPPSPFGEFSGVAGSDSLAIRVRDEVVNDLRIAWNDPLWPCGLYTAWFGELNPINNDEMPSVLIETAFHDSDTDAESILDPRFRDMYSRAVYQAIVKWWYYDHDGPGATPITTVTLLPEPPTHLAVRNLGDGTVRVSWQAPPSNAGDDLLGDPATGYIVQISEDGFGFNDGTATTATSMDIAGLTPGEVCYVRVIATNAGGQSFPTEIGGVLVQSSSTSSVLVVNGFDRLDRGQLLVEDDPYAVDPMLRERLARMNHYGYIRTYADALNDLGISFDSASNEAVRDQDVDMGDYEAVIWQCGEESGETYALDSGEGNRIWVYVWLGGSLFISGSEIAWDMDDQDNGAGAAVYNNLFFAEYIANDADTYVVVPVGGSIFDGLPAFTFDNGSLIYDVDMPDVIAPIDGSTSTLAYSGGTGGTAAVVYDDMYKLVNFGFPFEAVSDPGMRLELMYAIAVFLELDVATPPPPADIVVESRDAAGVVTPAPTYVEHGAWVDSSIKSAAPGLLGTGSRFITYEVPNFGTDHATLVPDIVTPGKYEVFVTWANGANCYDARHRVTHYLGQTDLLVDQIASGAPEPSNYDVWHSLGQYWFDAGQDEACGALDISEETVTGRPSPTWDYRVYADAAKWVFIAPWPHGDYTGDGEVDGDDFGALPGCLAGPNNAYGNAECEAFDTDLDGDVDLLDVGGFQQAFGN